VTHPDNDPQDINARWLWAWWRPQWDLRHGQPPACLVCAATGPLLLLDRQEDPHRTIVFRDMVAVCTPCAARAEQLVAARTANSRRWHGMPRALVVDAVLHELATGSTSIDRDDGAR